MRADLHCSNCSKVEATLEGCQNPDRDTLIIFLPRAVGRLYEAESRGDVERGMELRDTEFES